MSVTIESVFERDIQELLEEMPFIADFFSGTGVALATSGKLKDFFADLDEDMLEEYGTSRESLLENFLGFLSGVLEITEDAIEKVESVTVIGGFNKKGEAENVTVTVRPGEIICLVGPTGAGKSRLLGDIEWVAQEDTPTKRKVLINGEVPDSKWRFSTEHKLVAQLTQNMNFVMDLTVYEFVLMHAQSRLVQNPEEVARFIIDRANELAGEQFTPETPITSLSGGQSRALMIADTAYLSKSPIILIDEIENAGIDRKKALDLLTGEEKIVFMATHDPILALMGDKRLVINHGGIAKVLETTDGERANLAQLQQLDAKLMELRTRLRYGDRIEEI